jgi:hypothetical protein
VVVGVFVLNRDFDTKNVSVLFCNTAAEPIREEDVEIKPDGTIYLPEIKYRRRLNQAFGPGAWAMKPIGAVHIEGDTLTRAYQLFW